MRKLAAFARKVAAQVARRFGATSGSGGPLPGAAGRAAPGERKISTETRPKAPRSAVWRSTPGEPRAPSESRARPRRKIAPEPLPGAAGKVGRKAAEGKLKAELLGREALAMKKCPFFAEGTSASPSTSTATSRAPPPPRADSDFWYKMMMLGGSSIAFLIHLLKGYVDKEVELQIKVKESEEKDKVIKEKDQELELKKRELAIATVHGKRRGWFGQ